MDWNAYTLQQALSPEQQQLYVKQQQEQWFEYQRQYATWNASYGEQYAREIQSQTIKPPPPPAEESQKPPEPPSDNKQTFPPNFSTPPFGNQSHEPLNSGGPSSSGNLVGNSGGNGFNHSRNAGNTGNRGHNSQSNWMKNYGGGGQGGRDSGNYNKNVTQTSSNNNNSNNNNSSNNNSNKNQGRNQNVNQSQANNRGNNRNRGNNSNRGNMGNRYNRNVTQHQEVLYQKPPPEDYNQSQSVQPKETTPAVAVNEKSQEEVLFDEQFRKWEEEFDNWKKANVNHPDIVAYREYEKKFEECRQKLLERREVMMKKKNDQQQITKPPKTAEQTHFENQWKAGNSSTNEVNKPNKAMSHKTPTPSRMEAGPSRNVQSFHDDNYKNYDPFREEQIPSGHLDYNEEPNTSLSSSWIAKTTGIPGLDLVPEKPPVDEIIDERLDEDVTAVVNLIDDEVSPLSNETEVPNREKTNVEGLSAAGLSNILNNPKILELLAASLGATTSTEEKSSSETQNQDQQGFGRNDQQPSQFDRNDQQQQPPFDRNDQQFGRNDQQKPSRFDRNDQQQKPPFDRNDQQQPSQFDRNDQQQQFGLNDQQQQQQFGRNDQQQQQQFGRNDQQFTGNDQQFARNDQQFPRNDQQFPRNDQQKTQFGLNDQQQQQFGRTDQQQFGRNDQSYNQNRERDNNQQRQIFNSNRSDYFNDKQPIEVSSEHNDSAGNRQQQQQQRPGLQSLLDMPFNESNKFNQNQRNRPMDANRFNNEGNNFNQNFNNNPGMQRQNSNNMGNQPNQMNNNFNNQQRNNFNPSNNFNNSGMQTQQQQYNPQQQQQQFPQQQQQHQFPQQHQQQQFPQQFLQQQQQQQQFPQQQQQQNQFQQNMINNDNQQVQRPIEEAPTFKPAKIIDYNHRPKPSFEETLLEFRVFKSIEYNHRSKKTLLEFVADIDVEKILEKKKQIALRKKILEYLKNATNPADTVSNPNYPKNWVAVEVERPALKNKRRKLLTAKIKRIIQQKKDHEQDAKLIPVVPDQYKNTIPIMDLLTSPGRYKRPPKIVFLLRGAAGSGKTYLSFLISLKEKLIKGVAPKVLRIDDFFLVDTEVKGCMKRIYEYDESMENNYMQSISEMFMKAIKTQDFIIVDAPFIDLEYYTRFYNAASKYGFTVFTCEMELNPQICFERNIHDRSLKDVQDVIARYKTTPSYACRLNPLALFTELKEEEPNRLYALNKYNEVIAKRENELKAVKMNTDDISSEEEQFDGFSDDDDDIEFVPPKKMKMSPTIEETLKSIVENDSKRKQQLSKISIDDLLLYPGRKSRPPRIVIILRGASGSGKSYLAKLIRDKEIEMKGSSPRTLSIDNYFIINEQETYEYDPDSENTYMENVKKSFKKTISEGFYDFVIVDCNNIDLTNYNFFYATAKQQDFSCYTIEMEMDPKVCFDRNIHDRTLKDIEETIKRFMPTPYEHQLVDPKSLFPVKDVIIETEEISSDDDCVVEVKSIQTNIVEAGTSKKVNLLEAKSSLDEVIEGSPSAYNSDDENWEDIEEYDLYKGALCIDSFLCGVGRETRPSRVAIILRGCTGSGKSYLTKLIVTKEMEKCGIEPKVFCVDEQYFKDNEDPKNCTADYDHSMDSVYIQNVEEAYNALITDVTTNFIIIDVANVDLKNYLFFYNSLKKQDFEIYTIKLEVEPKVCLQNSGRKVTLESLQKVWDDFEDIPEDHLILNPSALVGKAVKFKRKVIPEEDDDEEEIGSFGPINKEKSKWDDDGFGSDLARLDGITNKVRQPTTMEHYLQMDDYESEPVLQTGKKRVRWADIEAKKKQIRSRERGFVVGQTDWDEMMDPSEGRSALIQTKYIERNPNK